MDRYDELEAPGRRPDSRNRRHLLLALGALAAFAVLLVVASQCQPPVVTTDIVWIAEKTERAPGAVPQALRERVQQIGAGKGGRLSVYSVGERPIRVTDTVSLDLDLGNGKSNDSHQQKDYVDKVLRNAGTSIAKSVVSASGFSLYAALQAAATEAARSGHAEVWLTSTVLTASLPPLDLAKLSADAEPTQAAEELVKTPLKELDLHDAELHIVLLTPVGHDQRPLNPRTEWWRSRFIAALGEQLGADVVPPIHDLGTADAWPRSSAVPPIVSISDPAPPAPDQPPRIDNTSFVPDSAELLDRASAVSVAARAAQEYRNSKGGYHVSVVGYCAHIGKQQTAQALSADRARVIAGLLLEQGIPSADVESSGVGFDERADPGQDAKSPAQRVVLIKFSTRS
ncbi:OmpA family protein [Amycolatopsis sp. cmx-4-68]|uniref:OmpA family protein n=1 Tax=Amycolatopsis sp. cmx-4-68 TaxID=2790938 RepID=UPI00397AD0B7